jgi:CRISPR/Cas system-associated protein endoribonuclease Cas2
VQQKATNKPCNSQVSYAALQSKYRKGTDASDQHKSSNNIIKKSNEAKETINIWSITTKQYGKIAEKDLKDGPR